MTENRKIKTQKTRIDSNKKLKKVKLLFTKQAKSGKKSLKMKLKKGRSSSQRFFIVITTPDRVAIEKVDW